MRIWSLALVLLVACSSKTGSQGQSFHDGVAALCDLPNHVPEPVEPYDKRLAEVAAWAEKNITNPEARQVGNIKSLAANKDALANAVAKAAIQHCVLLDNGMELQSFADAMKLVCEGTGKGPEYFKSHLLNAEVVRFVSALGEASTTRRVALLNESAKRAGLASCAFADGMSGADTHVPIVPDVALAAIDPASTLAITPDGIVIEGKTIVAVTNGDVDAAEKEGGALGIMIPRVRDFAKALAAQLAAKTRPLDLTLVVDPATPYRLLVEVLFSVKVGGFTSFALAVHAGKALKAIPLVLPDKVSLGTPPKVGMAVSVTKDKLILWSISGSEGTLAKPALAVAAGQLEDLQKALAAIVAKHWKDGKRAPADRAIITLFDGAIPMQHVAEVLAAVRATTDGKELFPDVRLSSGFE